MDKTCNQILISILTYPCGRWNEDLTFVLLKKVMENVLRKPKKVKTIEKTSKNNAVGVFLNFYSNN